ncbi:hypothetical protein C2S53_003772 [Perilla frutescens var. hirtella]|uniref:Protein kinase domain-containing protein n=1 Tax=Perilla frutescens var. hirtella TaxID=608512 RepID=A0AAD4J050_PERFH|nr:hypothetical protein C2S53_003772 [Perilla frutescens var. hirtella]
MKKDNMSSFFISFEFFIFCVIILSKFCSGADYQYEACVPTNCGSGPHISFPFYVPTIQESYCGYPGFVITCRNGVPFLQMSENEYVVEDIFYQNRSLHVYNAAVLSSNGSSSCFPRIRNTTLPAGMFDYVSKTSFHLLSDCKNLSEELLRYENALENCEENVVAPVELYGDEGEDEVVNVVEALRRGFLINWTANRPHSRSCPSGNMGLKRRILLIGGVTLAALTFTCIIAIIFTRRKQALLRLFGFQNTKPGNEKDIELFLKKNGNLAPMRYKYSDIKKMTKSFSENLGKGGYSTVYKGRLHDGQHVAVKILNESKGNGEEFMNEVASISRTSHINIANLLGFCFEGSKRALIYDFMPNGSLDKFIQNPVSPSTENVLGWQKLYEIALGIARGLEYLHQGCNTRILHFDIKPHNVLLDKDLNPRISDFGLTKLCPNRSSMVSMLGARGTVGYIAPEVFCRNFGEVSYKSDVYSYGMMVLEIAGGRKNISRGDVDHSSETYFPQYIYKELDEMDAERNDYLTGIISEDESQLVKRKLMIVGLWCIQTNPKDRPSMTKVVEMLEGKLGSLEVPPKADPMIQVFLPTFPPPLSSKADPLDLSVCTTAQQSSGFSSKLGFHLHSLFQQDHQYHPFPHPSQAACRYNSGSILHSCDLRLLDQ